MFGFLARSNVKYADKNPNKVVTKFTFSSLFDKAWLLAMTPTNLMAGFKKAGVDPLNRHANPVINEIDVIEQDPSDTSKGTSATPTTSAKANLVLQYPVLVQEISSLQTRWLGFNNILMRATIY